MPRDQELEQVHYKTWKKVTLNEVDDLSHIVISGKIELRVGDASTPTGGGRGWPYKAGQGETRKPLADYSPSGNRQVWMRALNIAGASVLISHG